MKTVIKLAIAAAVLHAVVRSGISVSTYYQLKDATLQLLIFGDDATTTEIHHDIVATAEGLHVALAAEKEPERVLKIIRAHLKPHQRVFVGVVSPIDPRIETPEEVRDRVLLAAKFIPLQQLGTTDDCGFSPFSDDTSTTRKTAFAKIRARVTGTALAAAALGGRQ